MITITNFLDEPGKITLVCPKCFWKQKVSLKTWRITQTGFYEPTIKMYFAVHPFTCGNCGTELVSYVDWIVSDGLTEGEIERSKRFVRVHKHKEIEYIVSPISGLGYKIEIRCLKCGEVEDITDYMRL